MICCLLLRYTRRHDAADAFFLLFHAASYADIFARHAACFDVTLLYYRLRAASHADTADECCRCRRC